MTATIAAELATARRCLAEASDMAALDAEVLLAHVLNADRAVLRARPEQTLAPAETARYRGLIAARQGGTPVAYLTGRREFWSLSLRVTRDTLVPRPETELLVERAIACLPAGESARVLELGTGSGAIALAIAYERPDVTIWATDVSSAALAVARDNARTHNVANVRFLLGDWFAPIPAQRFDAIVSNPPYLSDDDLRRASADVRAEPRLALAAGRDGLRALRCIIGKAAPWLQPGGHLLLEHGDTQAEAVGALLKNAGFTSVRCHTDLAGHERVSEGVQPAP